MNKKNLSVVLAGAMLATSVAPVLADTTTATEYSLDNISVLQNKLINTMKTKMLTTNSALKGDGSSPNEFLSADVVKELKTGASAYGVRVLDLKGNKVDETYIATDAAVKTVLDKAKEGYTVELIERDTTEFYGEIIPGKKITKGTEVITYNPTKDFDTLLNDTKAAIKVESAKNKLVDDFEVSTDKDALTVKINKLKNPANAADGKETITLTEKNQKIDGRLPLTADDKLLDYAVVEDVQKFDHFDTLTTWTASEKFTSDPTVKDTYKMTAASENDENTYKASDLYDGLALTAKGTELASDIANAKENKTGNDEELVKVSARPTGTQGDASLYKFNVYYYKNKTEAAKDNGTIDGKEDPANTNVVAYKAVTVYSSNLKEIQSLYDLVNPTSASKAYEVGIVAGQNRYETAVNVAKAQGIDSTTYTNGGNIVLVNGESLVDGLSAAPLAAKLTNTPVLLTKSDSLPKETKEYIKTLTNNLTSAQKKSITINLVGGNSVLNESLVSELEDMGFYVKRFGGDNREATSLAVAKEVATSANKDNDVFVVGGNGEADAMAISAVAARDNASIIVSSVNGLSEDALDFLSEKSAKGDVTVVGGESVVSASELESINDSLSLNKASRLAGENRFETNAKIIEKYYTEFTTDTGVGAVVIAKDGVAKKGELVDALAAANYAAQKNAPIVLATNSLNDVQKNALLKMDIRKNDQSKTIKLAAQVGNGVEKSVLETVAGLFGLSNK